jgi:hypothetical protein
LLSKSVFSSAVSSVADELQRGRGPLLAYRDVVVLQKGPRLCAAVALDIRGVRNDEGTAKLFTCRTSPAVEAIMTTTTTTTTSVNPVPLRRNGGIGRRAV